MPREDNSLTHYASKYYDPVKAHEYYMRNRELKGRRSSGSLNDEGKKVWNSVKNEISSEKKIAVETAKNERDKRIEELRQKASKTREAISARLAELEEALAKKAQAERESIERKRASELDKLLSQPIPEGLSREERARFMARRDQKIAALYKDSKSNKAKISRDVASENATNKKNAATQRNQVATELKSAIQATRDAYMKSKTSLDESYETIFQNEYDKVLASYEKPESSKTKKTGSSKKKKG